MKVNKENRQSVALVVLKLLKNLCLVYTHTFVTYGTFNQNISFQAVSKL